MLLRFPLWNGYNFAVIKFLRFKHKQFVIIKYGVTRTVVKTLSKRCQGAVNAFTEISVILTPFTWQRDDYALATRSGSAVRKRHSVVYNSYYSKDSQSVIFRLAYYTADFAYDMDSFDFCQKSSYGTFTECTIDDCTRRLWVYMAVFKSKTSLDQVKISQVTRLVLAQTSNFLCVGLNANELEQRIFLIYIRFSRWKVRPFKTITWLLLPRLVIVNICYSLLGRFHVHIFDYWWWCYTGQFLTQHCCTKNRFVY